MKKILAILMSAVLLLGLLAGCGGVKEEQPIATEGTQSVVTPSTVGMLVLNVNGSVNITYDADGLVLNVEGIDTNGTSLAGEYTDYLGKSCSEVVCDLITNSKMSGIMSDNYHCVMIKQAIGSALPGATFLETIQKDAEAAVATVELDATVVLLTENELDEDGYINLESAKALIVAALGVDNLDTLDGTISPIDGLYGFTITAGALEGDYIVDAVSGLVVEGQLDGYNYNDSLEPEESEVFDPTSETLVEETTEDTTPITEDPVIEPEDTSSTEEA